MNHVVCCCCVHCDCYENRNTTDVDGPTLGGIQSQAGWGFEQSDLVGGVPPYIAGGLELADLKVSSNPNCNFIYASFPP